ncbi:MULTISPECIES: polyribonucleotide nucleotidyltransferase [Acetobacterium]|uniref:Polyribonucleotide nucleotidyltransferase n=1 Tax=Acetobacterium wieringae TaxID=52694 RepID=A0A1F2PEK1_9FIRM|nr:MULTISPECIES: polyribonucleotide nucleotidyltransferase [Acetobacterium]MEA4804838.1 polyribonucleotide nucleotidyltransferase [Acetobacterium wieringae]OFV69475.1 polyribonucleotide nucleotidyltransferase [Acetobacterium wieringae]OXS26230.1 MAG: polyribonucleotide nucleotidyltransferase [Acetobacterium sp. MES1]
MNIFETQIAGRPFRVEIGEVAQLAKGAAMIRYGKTEVLAVASASKKPREGMDFFPLSCDYEEKQYSVGKFPGGFIKREGRPTERAILNSRLMDRPIRPLFPKGFRNDVQVVATIMSVDQDNAPEIAAMIGSSIALSISDIPFNGPTGAVAVGYIDGKYIINPNEAEREISELSLIVSGTKDAIMMVEAGANEVSEELMLEAILLAHEEIKKIVAFQEEIVAAVGKEKQEYTLFTPAEEIKAEVVAFLGDQLTTAVKTADKLERLDNIEATKNLVRAHFAETYPNQGNDIDEILNSLVKKEIRRMILEDRIRPDNRKMDEIRPITAKIDFLERPHGSGLFTRGETQVLSVVTLGVLGDVQKLDGLSNEDSKRYIHHYNFPAYSVGEARPSRGPGRREIGHGALAERALIPVLPSEDEFPYAIRVVSEVLSSNGSTSQASVCGSSLSLMAAGVPLKAPVAGIAMGLIKEDDKLAILSDIQGMEDFLGDMDFKVAGTAEGITAIQMDIKIDGINKQILTEALEQARIGRLHILGIMNDEIAESRKDLSPYAPRIIIFQIKPDKIRDVIGSGGKVINKIIDDTGVKIDIEDDGRIFIASVDTESGNRAKEIIENIVREVEVGEVLTGKVVRIMNFGAFVSLPGGKDGLVHISKLAHERVNAVEDVVKIGDEVTVKVMEIDGQGRINLSRKAVLPKE